MTTADARRVGRAVKNRRIELFNSQRAAATEADVGTTTWQRMEAGIEIPKTQRLRRQISKALQWPPDAIDVLLLGGSLETEGIAASLADELAEGIAGVSVRVSQIERELDHLKQLAQMVRADYQTPGDAP